MNIPLLKKVRAAILAEPKKFDMGEWFISDPESPCGTAACIGGWAVAIFLGSPTLKDARAKFHSTEITGRIALDIDESTVSSRLFYVSEWPENFALRYLNAKTPKDRADITAVRIDHFIKTNGAE